MKKNHRVALPEEVQAMAKKGKKWLVATLAVGALFGGALVSVHASNYVSNSHIRTFPSARRPLIGNIRGEGNVSQVGANNGIRARANVRNHDSGGRYLNTTLGQWSEITAPRGQNVHWAFVSTSSTTTGTSRRGRIQSVGQRRATINNS